MLAPHPLRRRALTAAVCGAAFLVHDGRATAATSYALVADRLQTHLDALWSVRLGRYDPGRGGTVTEVNANLLLAHAVAALGGQTGPTREDDRARRIAVFLTGPQEFVVGAHPGWLSAPAGIRQHPVFDTEAADALAYAYRARIQLGLDPATVAAIQSEIAQVAASADYRWPALRLNQINWYCAIYAADATVNGAGQELAAGMRLQVARLFSDPAAGMAGTFGPGLRFHYLPARVASAPVNVDSAEYANIVLGFARFYVQARAAGMPPPAGLPLLREWVRRVLAGYWTHAGYLNWDTGLSFGRWHQRKKAAYAQLALIGIASAPELQPDPEWGQWAKWLLDRGLERYATLADREHTIPSAVAYGVHVVPQSRANAYLAAARYEANAMRALDAGLQDAPKAEPPPLYAYDPDTGRLAVTTPAYNTAIVAVNQHAFPYGGLDLARLFDGRQEVAGNLGGRAPAAFGLVARARSGRVLLETQYGWRDLDPAVTPLRLLQAPRGVGATATSGVRAAYAGPFTTLVARGSVRAHGLRATVTYRFTARAIDAQWTLAGRRATVRTRIGFPSWGRSARVRATLRSGRSVWVGHRPLALSRVRSLHVMSAASGYRLTPLRRPRGATVRLVDVAPQSSDPHPGPTVTITLRAPAAPFGARLSVADR